MGLGKLIIGTSTANSCLVATYIFSEGGDALACHVKAEISICNNFAVYEYLCTKFGTEALLGSIVQKRKITTTCVSRFAGHCPTYKFRVGVSPEQGLHQFHKEIRDETFHFGKKLTQADDRFRRTQPFSPDNYDYKRPCVAGRRGLEIQQFGDLISKDREKIRDYRGKLKMDPYFQVPVRNEDLYRPYEQHKAYYIHHNLWPEMELTDSGWAYGDQHLRYYHGEKDERGVVLHSYIKKRKPTFDPPWLQAGLGLRDKKDYA